MTIDITEPVRQYQEAQERRVVFQMLINYLAEILDGLTQPKDAQMCFIGRESLQRVLTEVRDLRDRKEPVPVLAPIPPVTMNPGISENLEKKWPKKPRLRKGVEKASPPAATVKVDTKKPPR